MYTCNNCKAIFTSPLIEKSTYEKEYGLYDGHTTPVVLNKCPNCGDDEVDEYQYSEDQLTEMQWVVDDFNKNFIG